MAELDLPATYPDTTLRLAAPQPPAFVREPSPGRAAVDVPERDVLSFGAAIADAGSGQPTMSASTASSKPSASGSLAEMTAALGIYRDALASAEPSSRGPATAGLAVGEPQPAAVHVPSLQAVRDAGLTGARAADVSTVVPVTKPTSTDGAGVKQPATAQDSSLHAVSDAELTDARAVDVSSVMLGVKWASTGRVEVKQPAAAKVTGSTAVNDDGGSAVQVLVVSSAVPSAPTAAMDVTRDGPSVRRFDVATIVQQVTRELGMRDLAALDSGRKVVLRLDERILPQTVLTFQAQRADGVAAASGSEVQVLVGLQTQSDEVRAFLDSHGQSLIDAMAREAPGLCWLPGGVSPAQGAAAKALLQPASDLAGTASLEPTQLSVAVDDSSANGRVAFREHDAASTEQNGHGSSGQQQGGSPSDPGNGQRGRSADDGALTDGGAVTSIAAEWASLSEAERVLSAQTFNDAVSGRS